MKIKIYTTSTCGFCRAEKQFLDSHKVKYEEVHADEDRTAAEELVRASGQLGVPFTIVIAEDGTEEKILGFDQARLEAVLGL